MPEGRLKRIGGFVQRHAHWLLLGIGTALWLMPTALGLAGVEPGASVLALAEWGKIAVGSGVFAAVVKSHQFTEIFRNELTKIIFSPDFVNQVSHLPEIWKDIAIGRYKARLPAIAEGMNESLSDRVPLDRSFYYDRHRVNFVLDWEDEERAVLRMKIEVEIIVRN